jgi:hypothetical protein
MKNFLEYLIKIEDTVFLRKAIIVIAVITTGSAGPARCQLINAQVNNVGIQEPGMMTTQAQQSLSQAMPLTATKINTSQINDNLSKYSLNIESVVHQSQAYLPPKTFSFNNITDIITPQTYGISESLTQNLQLISP